MCFALKSVSRVRTLALSVRSPCITAPSPSSLFVMRASGQFQPTVLAQTQPLSKSASLSHFLVLSAFGPSARPCLLHALASNRSHGGSSFSSRAAEPVPSSVSSTSSVLLRPRSAPDLAHAPASLEFALLHSILRVAAREN